MRRDLSALAVTGWYLVVAWLAAVYAPPVAAVVVLTLATAGHAAALRVMR